MQNSEIDSLFSKVFKPLYLRFVQTPFRATIGLVLIFVFGVPFVNYLQHLVSTFPYLQMIASIVEFLLSQEPIWYLVWVCFISIFAIIIYLFIKQYSSSSISDNFASNLNRWSTVKESGWFIQPCDDKPGKMLSVTNCYYPGILKDACSWYDYELSFIAKIGGGLKDEDQNFSFVVRAENNLNGVMFQITCRKIRPHLLYNSTYILDAKNDEQLQTLIKPGEWVGVRVRIQGNIVKININGFDYVYKIPSLVIDNVSNIILKRNITLVELEEHGRGVEKTFQGLVGAYRMEESPAKGLAVKVAEDNFREITQGGTLIRVAFDYQKGSVGFRESGPETAYFKNLKLKKI